MPNDPSANVLAATALLAPAVQRLHRHGVIIDENRAAYMREAVRLVARLAAAPDAWAQCRENAADLIEIISEPRRTQLEAQAALESLRELLRFEDVITRDEARIVQDLDFTWHACQAAPWRGARWRGRGR